MNISEIDKILKLEYERRASMIAGDGTTIKRTDVVTYSKEGIEKLSPYYPNRLGFCVGFSQDGSCFRIIWHGNKIPVNYHRSFIKKHISI